MKLFDGINENDLTTMLKCLNAVKKTYLKGEIILDEGASITAVGLVQTGKIQIVKDDFSGNKVIISEVGEGETFAEAIVCSGLNISPVSVFAVEKTEVLFINFNRIISMCNSACQFHKKLIENTIKLIALKNISQNSRIELLSKKTIRERVLFYLLAEQVKNNNSQFKIPFSREQLAEYLCVDRSALSRELCRMRDEGIVGFDKNEFMLKKTS